jgi:hypothetical protein
MPDETLIGSPQGKVPEVYAIGDCGQRSLIVDAIGTGLQAAPSV